MAGLIEVFGATVVCPVEGCPFVYVLENCTDQKEAEGIFLVVAELHGRFTHGMDTFFEPKIRLVEGIPRKLVGAGRPN